MKEKILKLDSVERVELFADFSLDSYSEKIIFLTSEEIKSKSFYDIERMFHAPDYIAAILITKSGKHKMLSTFQSSETAFKKSSGIVAYIDHKIYIFESEDVAYSFLLEETKLGTDFIVYIPSESQLAERKYALQKAKDELEEIEARADYLRDYIKRLS